MKSFAIAQATSAEQVSALLSDDRFSLPVLKAGGMDVLDHLKEGIIDADVLVNLATVRDEALRGIGPGRFGALTTLAELAMSSRIRGDAPVLAQAADSAATPQVRNVATAAGNLLQRPRCWYYRSEQFDCLKKDGHMCYAFEGENKFHAVFGDGPCHIVHPSNIAPALCVLDGAVHLSGSRRASLPLAELFHMPDDGIKDEHNLERHEVVTHITFDSAPHSGFYAVKEKQSFDWPLVMAAVALELDGMTIRSARVCAGAVAPVPWMLPKVQDALRGVRVDDEAAVKRACALAIDGATPMTQNAYKLKLLPVAIRRAILKAAG